MCPYPECNKIFHFFMSFDSNEPHTLVHVVVGNWEFTRLNSNLDPYLPHHQYHLYLAQHDLKWDIGNKLPSLVFFNGCSFSELLDLSLFIWWNWEGGWGLNKKKTRVGQKHEGKRNKYRALLLAYFLFFFSFFLFLFINHKNSQ